MKNIAKNTIKRRIHVENNSYDTYEFESLNRMRG